ncbi:aminoacyl-tRNA hydrolase [Thiohalocapsa sp.]|jgi:PTH1 family peptidyl-tRNA hydrolase|uniref:aminoacyl-tRNA hydrolase n=1 Tax=Thiohalocapsa sp. TaxID=2497641 RepID=UPI0025CD67F6|nr:aminoacyl-tRNA hydrolase [Thiohalocapsa sp.]
MSHPGIRLVIGLGNPGPDYALTRHNAGFWLVDRLAELHHGEFRAEAKFHGVMARVTVGGVDLRLLKPTTFMNHSGRSVVAVSRYFDIPPEQILIAYDELDLPPGRAKLKLGGGHAGHNGMRDSINALGSRDFWRLRIGIGHPGEKSRVVGYVLGRPSQADAAAILDVVDDAVRILPDLIEGRFQLAINRLHSAP